MTVIVCRGTHPGFGMSPSWQEPPSFEPIPKLCPALVSSCLTSPVNFNLTSKDAVRGEGGWVEWWTEHLNKDQLGWAHRKSSKINEFGLYFWFCHLLALWCSSSLRAIFHISRTNHHFIASLWGCNGSPKAFSSLAERVYPKLSYLLKSPGQLLKSWCPGHSLNPPKSQPLR